MRRIITLTLLALTLSGGVALADRDRDRGRSSGRDHRWNNSPRSTQGVRDRGVRARPRDDRRFDRRVDRRVDRPVDRRIDRRAYVQRTRPTFRDNRFYFAGGYSHTYQRPVINVRYRDHYRRPALIVENSQPVAGYLWVPGQWQWNGYEWLWISGRYEIDQAYQDPYYDGAYDDDGGYYDGGGVQLQGGVSWGF